MIREYLCVAFSNKLQSAPKSLTRFIHFTQMTKNAYIGALVDGIVTEIHPYGVHIRLKNTDIR